MTIFCRSCHQNASVYLLYSEGQKLRLSVPRSFSVVVEHVKTSQQLGLYFDEWYSPLVRYATTVGGSLVLAEDMVQEVFLRLYREMRGGKEIKNPKAWMVCVLRHEIAKHARREKKEHLLLQWLKVSNPISFGPLGTSDGPHGGEPEIEPDDVTRFFSVLTAREREVMLLRMTALKYREIAEELDISTNSVSTLLARALRKLQKVLKVEMERADIFNGDVVKDFTKTLQ